jgi:hypothetical protein
MIPRIYAPIDCMSEGSSLDSYSYFAPPQRLVPTLVWTPVLTALGEIAALDTLTEQGAHYCDALLVARLEFKLEGYWLCDEQDRVVEGRVCGLLGDVAPFQWLVAWWEGAGWFEVFVVGVAGLRVVVDDAEAEFFAGDGALFVQAYLVCWFLGGAGCVLGLLFNVEHPCDGSDAYQEILVCHGLALACSSPVTEL